jgi:hypothetical protein
MNAYGLLRSRSMRLSNRSCDDNSAMRFSCAFTFRSRASVAADSVDATGGIGTGRSAIVASSGAADMAAVSTGVHGGTAAHPPLRPITPLRIDPEAHCHFIVCKPLLASKALRSLSRIADDQHGLTSVQQRVEKCVFHMTIACSCDTKESAKG